MKEVMRVGERVEIDGKVVYVHHIDDQEGWFKDAQLHPLFKPGEKPSAEDWKCEYKHTYEQCKCHQEIREYGQDESIYHSGDVPDSRWGIDGRSYAISKSKGVSRMMSAFKDYSKRGMCLKMTKDELDCVNFSRVTKGMKELNESPGCVIIDPTKAGDGYWNYEKISAQTQDVIHAMDVLEPDHQQLHQFDWSSGHAKSQEGGLMISSCENIQTRTSDVVRILF